MNCKLKKLLIGTLASTMLLSAATTGIAYAYTHHYTWLSLSYNSSHLGAVRSYDTPWYYVSITPSSLPAGATDVDVKVQKVNEYFGVVWSTETEASKSRLPLSAVDETYTYYIGCGNSGDRAFHFSTWGNGTEQSPRRNGFTADSVTLSSGVKAG